MALGKRWWWCLTLVLVAGCAVADDDDSADARGALTGDVCGFEVAASPQTIVESACDQGRTVFGPARFARETGKPTAETANFDVSADATVCITLRNGEDGDDRISSGSVDVDDDEFAVPSDFNQQVDGLETEVDLAAGTHTLEVDLASIPGSFVELEVREPFEALDTTTVAQSTDGTLELSNLATDHPLLTPNADGHHDTTVFNADVEPLITLPGKDDGSVDYFLEWEFVIVDLETCATPDTGITGTTAVNSPTNISATWDGTDTDGNTLSSGTYAYYFEVTLVDENGTVFGELTQDASPTYGMIIDTAPADFDEQPVVGSCDAENENCLCGDGSIGGQIPNCTLGTAHPDHSLLDTFDDPSTVDTSEFLTTTFDSTTGRWSVVADLREYNAAGLVPQGDGTWDDEAELRQWVADMTGVPVGSGDSLFNFDYTQLGTSTGLNVDGLAAVSFNHFFLDAITDENGDITVDGVTTDLDALLNGAGTAPSDFQVVDSRTDDECTRAGNTNGESTVTSKLCAFNEAIPIGGTNAGVFMLRSSVFDLTLNDDTTVRDEACIVNGIFSCTIRTIRLPFDSVEIEASYYVEEGGVTSFAFTESVSMADTHALSAAANRESVDGNADGVCTRAVTLHDGVRVRMDSADGSVSDTCIVNGIFL